MLTTAFFAVPLGIAAGLYLFTLVGGFAVLYSQMVLMNLMGQYIMYDLRKQIFGHLQKLDVQYFDKNPVGRLMTRVTTDVDVMAVMVPSMSPIRMSAAGFRCRATVTRRGEASMPAHTAPRPIRVILRPVPPS